MRCVGRKPRPKILSLPTAGERAWRHRVRLRILIVPWVTACLLAGPMGSLPTAHGSGIASLLSTTAEGKLTAIISKAPAVTTGQTTASPKMASRLQHLIARKAEAKTGAGQSIQTAVQDNIKVMLHLADGASLDLKTIESRGGRVLHHRKNIVTVEIPPDQIENVIQAEQGIVFARTPRLFRPLGNVTSEGVALTGASNFHNSGYRGAGVKVAVVDLGFKSLTESIAAGELPMNVNTRDLTGIGLETKYKHGTACAEIVHDMAPDAELHLLKIADETDFDVVLDYCLENHINIVSLSIGTFGSGPGNGTGPIDDICDKLRANGILVVAAAGNEAIHHDSGIPIGTHYKGVFTDTNHDNIHEFPSGVQGNILIALPDHDDDGNPADDEVSIIMRWDDWPNAFIDYDMNLYAYDFKTHTRGNLVGSSAGVQNGSQPPREEIVIDLPDNSSYQYFELEVIRKPGSPAGKEIEISTAEGNCFFIGATAYAQPIATSAGSIVEPADAASVFTVGAIDQEQYGEVAPLLEEFSSQGPTNAWAGSAARIKPDICGPDGVSSNAYGHSFHGTSASTPHVAGAAALLLSLHPNLLPGEVQSYLETSATDMGVSGKDNLYGWGRLRLQQTNVTPTLGRIGNKTINEEQLLRFTISASDQDKDNLIYEAFSLPAGAAFDPDTRTFSWQPSYHQQGNYTVTFRVSDGTHLQLNPYDAESINITVFNVPPKGDLNDSGTVNLADAIIAQRVLVRRDVKGSLRPDYVTSGADVNGDNVVGLQEAIWIFQFIANLR
jgi:subtilisin family serine protease